MSANTVLEQFRAALAGVAEPPLESKLPVSVDPVDPLPVPSRRGGKLLFWGALALTLGLGGVAGWMARARWTRPAPLTVPEEVTVPLARRKPAARVEAVDPYFVPLPPGL